MELSMVSNLRIGIVGGGFAGLYTVFFLRKYFSQGIDVTLFDKNNYFLYTLVLHEMATGTVNARHVVIQSERLWIPGRSTFGVKK
jgi:NADH:ubiquinone reductase (H+-translocating)